MRIIAGTARGRVIKAPEGMKVRPTTDRVREAIFSSLESRGAALEDARVLDLFAGSGALALEALSRGAASAVLVDRSAASLAAARRNVESLGFAERARVVKGQAAQALKRLAAEGSVFDLVFLDPPYAGELLEEALAGLARLGLLVEGGRIVAEHSSRREAPPPPEGFVIENVRIYGDTAVAYYRRER